jgi:hypothetical protein
MVKRHDSSIAILASNFHGFTPVCKVERTGTVYVKSTKIQVDSPPVIQKYNKYMRGVDRFDENFDRLLVCLRCKKWWFPLFPFRIDNACQNTWHLVKNSDAGKDFAYRLIQSAIVETLRVASEERRQ